jgi:peptidoglycan/xylan/chitin deacetylase (PgdA/CDA1 family)
MRPERTLGAAGVALLAAWCGPAAAPVFPPCAAAFAIPLRLPGRRGIALTFDDGPHPEGTPAVLAELERAGVRATFFLVGEQVAAYPALAAEIAAAGHEIGIHGYRHQLLLRRSPRALAADFDRAAATIGEATGVSSSLYRPPYGVFSLAGLTLARRRWQPLLWSRWGRDWEARASAESITRRAARRLAGGEVVLLHDADFYSSAGSWRATVAALPAIIEAALATGEPLVGASQSR